WIDALHAAGVREIEVASFVPAACSASIQRSLSAVGMVAATDCRPSRGPTSLISTSVDVMNLSPQ
ncbi:MAG: hypothetical protein EOO22_21980, partial [Comamonadaceae bacterium]